MASAPEVISSSLPFCQQKACLAGLCRRDLLASPPVYGSLPGSGSWLAFSKREFVLKDGVAFRPVPPSTPLSSATRGVAGTTTCADLARVGRALTYRSGLDKSLTPFCDCDQYGAADYWEERYAKSTALFEWYEAYEPLRPLFQRYMPRDHSVLQARASFQCCLFCTSLLIASSLA